MEGSATGNSADLQSSLSAAEQSTFNHDQQPIATYDAQGQLIHLSVEEELPVPTMNGAMEDAQQNVVYHMPADRGTEAEDIHVAREPNNTVDFNAGIQHSGINWVSSKSEGEEDMQKLDGGDNPSMQCSNNTGNDPHDDAEVSLATNPPAYNDVHDEQRSIFVDFDEAADVDDDEERSFQEQDNQIEEDIGFGFGSIKAFVYPQTTQIISQHLTAPSQQSFTTLNDLLSSHNAPGRGLYRVEKVLEHEEGRAARLEEKMKYIAAELEEVRARRDRANECVRDAREIVRNAREAFSKTRNAAGIFKDLWEEYEAFCESLAPKFGSRGGWSITCFYNHNGAYLQSDPDLELFLQSAEMPLRGCNFRCEATTVKNMGRTEYVVEFWPLANLEPRTTARGKVARTWEQQYPKLYKLANKAANSSPGEDTVAKALLRSLPDANRPFSGGWLFEYALEPARAQHPNISRRWSYRSACEIPFDAQQDQVDVTAKSESESSESDDQEMEDDESDLADIQDIEMEDDGSGSAESQDTKMEDDD